MGHPIINLFDCINDPCYRDFILDCQEMEDLQNRLLGFIRKKFLMQIL